MEYLRFPRKDLNTKVLYHARQDRLTQNGLSAGLPPSSYSESEAPQPMGEGPQAFKAPHHKISAQGPSPGHSQAALGSHQGSVFPFLLLFLHQSPYSAFAYWAPGTWLQG